MAGVADSMMKQLKIGGGEFKQLLKKHGLSAETATEDELISMFAKEKRMPRPNTVVSEPSGEEMSKFAEGVNKPRPTKPMFGEAPIEYKGVATPTNRDASDWSVPLKSEYAQDVIEEAKATNVPIQELMKERGHPYSAADMAAPVPSPMLDLSDTRTPLPKAGMSGMGGKVAGVAGVAGLGYASTTGADDFNKYMAANPVATKEEDKKPVAMAMGDGEEKKDLPPTSVTPPEIKDMLAGFVKTMPEFKDATDWKAGLDGIKDKRQGLANQLKSDVLEASAAANVASSSIEKRELIETITNAIGQIASGMYGMKSGLDLSGAKFNKTDWNAKLESIRANLKDSIARLTDAQQLDQAVLSEEKENLLRNKDDLIKKYEMDFKTWATKGDILRSQQGVATDKARMQFDADKFNADLDFRAEKAIKEQAAKGATAKDQVSAGLKATLGEKKSIADKWGALAIQAGSEKKSDEEKSGILAQMEALDRQYTEVAGRPLLSDPANPLMPRSYSDISPSDIAIAAQGRFKEEDKLKMQLSQFQNKRALDYVERPEFYLNNFAQSQLGKMGPEAAAQYARREYRNGLKMMFEEQAKYEAKQQTK